MDGLNLCVDVGVGGHFGKIGMVHGLSGLRIMLVYAGPLKQVK